ncbi:hypothetical protein PCC9214_05388 (plasmid) [Planktothrix tepida]|uniref:Uncharacterized protein n=1 Tax=Planktothrix tepida PCC 9214 TaxID=671072 RepID=A0A1J1LNC0_9CYAN|nr:helix-turn-helix domain-containing protein [Planktothrix tepida]CAD5988464.1 hypothetical protein PCC9214_05388 [Planktothrix tepida]CUR33911.1 hypothetical protein PL921460020 [Planktothrix tepida PCC 9214]
MEIKHELSLTEEELKIVKLGLLGKLNKNSPYWNKAQRLADSIPIEVKTQEAPKAGITETILLAIEALETATSQEIVEHLGLDYPNSVSALCSKLYRNGKLERFKTEIDPYDRQTQGVRPIHRYKLAKKTIYELKEKKQSGKLS